MDVQNEFFAVIKSALPKRYKLADIISEILEISPDSAYRRIRGEKELSLKELYVLCNHFKVSMDAVLHLDSDTLLSKYISLNFENIDNYYSYLEEFNNTLEPISKSKTGELYFTAEDIPIFHFMPFYELTVFKVYSWFQTVNNLKITYEEFSSQLDKDALVNLYQKIYEKYTAVNSTEVWTETSIDPILKSLEYYYDLQSFADKNVILTLCQQVLSLIENFETWTEEKTKGKHGGNFQVYLSPVTLENSFMLVKDEHYTATNIKLFTINSISTTNALFCQETERWFNNTINKSLFLGASARERLKFFQTTKNKIHSLIEKLRV